MCVQQGRNHQSWSSVTLRYNFIYDVLLVHFVLVENPFLHQRVYFAGTRKQEYGDAILDDIEGLSVDHSRVVPHCHCILTDKSRSLQIQ